MRFRFDSHMIIKKVHWRRAAILIQERYGIEVFLDDSQDWFRARSACWFVSSQNLRIGTIGRPMLVLMAMAHELGHCISVRKGSHSSFVLQLKYNLNVRLTKKEKAAILSEEYRAWRYGFRFLRDNGFEVSDDMIRWKNI